MKEKETTLDIEREDKFVRSPVLENQVFCLDSWCGECGFTVLASSVYDLVEEEERHARKCCRAPHLEPDVQCRKGKERS